MQKHVLSKSTFIRGLKCSKSLYLNKHRKDLRDELSDMQKAIFNQGDMVGELAQQLFPSGVDCTTKTFYNFDTNFTVIFIKRFENISFHLLGVKNLIPRFVRIIRDI